MKHFKLKFLLLFFALAMAIPPAWAEETVIASADYTHNSDADESGVIYTGDGTWTYDATISYSYVYWKKANSGITYTCDSFTGNTATVTVTTASSYGYGNLTINGVSKNLTNGSTTDYEITIGSDRTIKFTTSDSYSPNITTIAIKAESGGGGGDDPTPSTKTASIVFGDNESDGNQDFATMNSGSVDLEAFLDYTITGADLISGIQCSKVYKGATGLKFSSSSVDGYLIITLAPNWKVTKISVNAKNWTSGTGKIQIIAGDKTSSNYTLTADYADYDLVFDEATSIPTIRINATNRLYVKYITIEYVEDGTVEPTLQEVSLSFPQTAYTATIGEAFTAPVLTVVPSAAADEVEFSSSNTAVATVAADGTITLVGAGTTTITASISDSETYQDASASYTLTVEEAPEPGSNEFVLVTNINQLASGKKILFLNANSKDSYAEAMGRQQSNSRAITTVQVSEDKVTTPAADTEILTLEKDGNYWLFKTTKWPEGGLGYLYAAGGTSNNYLRTEVTKDARAQATVTIASDGEATVVFNLSGDNPRNVLRHNSSSSIFNCYNSSGASGQKPVYIYVEKSDGPDAAEITVDPESVTITDATGDDKTGAISATVDPAGTVTATATDGWSATSSSVTYEGKALHAEGTATFSSEGATDVTADLEYNYTGPLYILGTVNNGGWAPNNYVAMTRGADGLYTAEVTASEISFTKRVAEYSDQGSWEYIYNYRFVPASSGNWGLTENTIGKFCDLDFDPSHVDGQKIVMDYGTYTVTINPATNQFKIDKVTGPVTYEKVTSTDDVTSGNYLIVYEGGNVAFDGSLATLDAIGNTKSVDITDNKITTNEAIYFTYDASAKTLRSANGKYIGNNSYDNNIAVSDSPVLTNTITIDGSGNAVITALQGKDNYDNFTTLRYNSASNQNRFRYYKTGQQAIQLYKEVNENKVATPTFSPAAGTYTSAQTVTISCATDGATISYSTDGGNTWVEGNTVTVGETKTILAKATKAGMEDSNVATATYTINLPASVEKIADLNGLAIGKAFVFTNKAVVVYNDADNHQMWIQDYEPTAGGAMVYGENTFTAADVLAAGWTGTWTEFGNTNPRKEIVDLNATTDGTKEPVAMKRTMLTTANVDEYVLLEKVTISDDLKITLGTRDEVLIYDKFGKLPENFEPKEGFTYDVKGIVIDYNGALEIYPLSIELNKKDVDLAFGETPEIVYKGNEITLTVTGAPEGATVTFECTPEGAVTFDGNKATFNTEGEVTITAKTAETAEYKAGEVSKTFNVQAKTTPTLTFDPNKVELTIGDEFTAPTLNGLPAGATVEYTVENEIPEVEVAKINDEGDVELTGKAGKATVTATYAGNDQYNGTSASYTIEVSKKDVTLEFGEETPTTAKVGDELTLSVTGAPDGLTVTYKSSDETVATVDENGKVTFLSEGEVTITANTAETDEYEAGEVSMTFTVTVPEVVAAPTFSLVAGSYTGAQTVIIGCATEEATILYSTDGGNTWTAGNTVNVDKDMTIMAKAEKDGYTTSATVTAAYIIDIPEELPTITPFKGYYQIKNNGNNKYANIAGRRTLNFTNAPADKAGTVIWLETNDKGQVQSIRSQAADLQGYANRAMRYVPQMVQLVADKLHAEGAGTGILGENGLDAIMDKFNECFDYHLYVEEAQGGWRLYGKTPSMQHVVDFYREHTVQVEEKLPMLEQFINDALDKLKEKIGGSSVFTPFSLHQIWENMGGTLTEPNDDASTMAFYREVLNNKNYVWDFAYQTAMIYVNNLKNHPRYDEVEDMLGEYAHYINMIEQVRPDFKYYVVQKDNKPDFISEGNVDITNNAARTIWTLEPRTKFNVNIAEENLFGCPLAGGVGGYATTLYTDFAYSVPDGVTAYKVTSIEGGNATIEALSGVIPAQTPVLLTAKEASTVTLTLSTEAGTAVTGNLLVGPDYLINEYKLTTPIVENIFNIVKEKLGQSFYDAYVAQYEHLMYLNSGTVNNKYFWGLKQEDIAKCGTTDEYDRVQCVVRSLEGGKFIDNMKVETNKAFLVTDEYAEITLNNLRGDVNHDGIVNIKDVTDLIDRLLEIPDPEHLVACEYCSDVNQNGAVNIQDVTVLIDILLGNTTSAEGGGN